MTRHPDWSIRLAQFADHCRRSQPTHCGYFAGRAIEVMTGENPMPKSITGRKRADLVTLRELGYTDHLDFVRQAFESTDNPRPGDLVIIDDGGEGTIGILQGRLVYVMSDAGMVMISRSDVTEAFRI